MLMAAVLPLLLGTIHESAVDRGGGSGRSADATMHTVRFQLVLAVPPGTASRVAATALQVSTPGNARYGLHLSNADVVAMAAPIPRAAQVVQAWCRMVGATRCTLSPLGFVDIEADVRPEPATAAPGVGTGMAAFILTEEVAAVTTAVFGLRDLPMPPSHAARRSAPAAAAAAAGKAATGAKIAVTPSVLDALYNISAAGVNVTRGSSSHPRRAVVAFSGEYMSQKDLTKFFAADVPTAQPGDDSVFAVVGDSQANGDGGTEAQLDIDYMMGTVPGIRTEFWAFEGMQLCQTVWNYSNTILAAADPPRVHTMSYGVQVNPASIVGCSKPELDTIELNFAKLAARGITLLIASGDDGAGEDDATKFLWPSWPASSPWVTAVGGTAFIGSTATPPEMAATAYGSGGGFSSLFNRSRATWQEQVVSEYLAASEKALPPRGNFAAAGRATPDVSMASQGYQVPGGIFGPKSVDGTSASTPAFGSLVSLLNEARAQAGKQALGFLNPFLYANPAAFTDITKGDNKHGRGGKAYSNGWSCTVGWDPVTGLGTPRFEALLAAALAA